MKTIMLVDAPSGVQELAEVGPGGSYFNPASVVWDERTDGTLPSITLGGMVRAGAGLVFDANRKALHDAAIAPAIQEAARVTAIEATIAADPLATALRGTPTDAQIDAYFAANVTTAAGAIQLLKRLVKMVVRRGLL